nr:MAG TPA: hypothetical protein [Caudoviricetes sp.]
MIKNTISIIGIKHPIFCSPYVFLTYIYYYTIIK